MRIVSLLGSPGSGKGSYGGIVAKALSANHMTTSDILKKHGDGSFSHEIEKGDMLDDVTVAFVLRQFLLKQQSDRILLDGFPRTIGQIQAMRETWPNELQINHAVHLNVPRQVCREKLLGRRLCTKCGGNYNIADVQYDSFSIPPNLPNDCDCAQVDWIRRRDDTPEVIDRRLDFHFKTISAILDYFARTPQGVLHLTPTNGYSPAFNVLLQNWLKESHYDEENLY